MFMSGQVSKSIIVILFLSIATNLVIFGYLFGYKPNSDKTSIEKISMPEELDNNIYSKIPDETRKEFIDKFKKRQQEVLFNKREILLIQLEIANLIQKDKVDEKQLSLLFERLTALRTKNIMLSQQTLFQTIMILPLAERVKIAKGLMQIKIKRQLPLEGAKNT
ncbi:MAG: hypothetical protein AB7V32_04725 [Candidatus Berkiella sp.]